MANEKQEQAVLDAARDERRERKALEALGAAQPGWTDAEHDAHKAQLERWLAASRRLAQALNSLNSGASGRVNVTRV